MQISDLLDRPVATTNTDELDQWKSKYELLQKAHKKLEEDFNRMSIQKQSEIDELNQSLVNYEKRAIELNIKI